MLSPAQSSALEGYVDAGGTLVVAGGLGWSADTAGLPVGLLPAAVQGIGPPMALPALADLVDAPPPPDQTDVDVLRLSTGSSATMSERRTPLAVQASRGAGQVTFSAFDPAAAPLASWPGTPAVLSRLFASAYQEVYYGQPSSFGGGLVPANLTAQNMGTASMTNLAADGGGSALLSPAAAREGLLGYLEDSAERVAPWCIRARAAPARLRRPGGTFFVLGAHPPRPSGTGLGRGALPRGGRGSRALRDGGGHEAGTGYR